jgi:hypothetical protein
MDDVVFGWRLWVFPGRCIEPVVLYQLTVQMDLILYEDLLGEVCDCDV